MFVQYTSGKETVEDLDTIDSLDVLEVVQTSENPDEDAWSFVELCIHCLHSTLVPMELMQ